MKASPKTRPISPRKLLAAAAAVSAIIVGFTGAASAGECPADKVMAGAMQARATEPLKVTDTVIAAIDLKDNRGGAGLQPSYPQQGGRKMTTRYKRGVRMIKQLDEEQVGQIVEGLADIAPDFASHVIEFAFGDIYSRPGLGLRDRQISTVSTLVGPSASTCSRSVQ